jgi:antitoxin MazE
VARATVRKWGKSLAVRVPAVVARAVGLTSGERVEVEVRAGRILVRRVPARSRTMTDSMAAADEIAAETRSYRLGGVSLRELLNEGRRG